MKQSFLLPLLIDFATLCAICLLFDHNVVLLGVLAVLLYLALRLWPQPFYYRLACFALLFGAIGEWACCRVQLWIYTNPTWQGLPIWLPLVWPLLMLTFWRISLSVDAFFEERERVSRLFVGMGWLLVAVYTCYSLIHIDKTIALVYALFTLSIIIWGRRRQLLLYFIVAALGGSFGEIICMRFDVWYYTHPWFTSVGIPLSLPLAWGLSAVVIALIAGGSSGKQAKP